MKKFILLFCFLFISIIGLVSCANKPNTTNTTKTEDENQPIQETVKEPITIRLQGGNCGQLDPYHHIPRGPGIFKMQLLYDSLLEKGKDGDIPWLAKSWDVSDDGTQYTFHLVENAKWHDGKPLTAEDVAFTFDYYSKHLPVYHSLVSNGEYIVKDVKILDPYSIQITLNSFNNVALSAIGNARILPKHIWENIKDPMNFSGNEATIGSGPFQLDSCNIEQGSYRFTAFNDYWGTKQAVDVIEWIPVSDPILAFENGEIDLINASPDMLSRYSNDPTCKVKSVSSLHSYRLMMNMEKSDILADINVRQAIAYSIDQQNIIDTVMRGSATLSSAGYVPMDSPWYNQNMPQYTVDIDKAKELLKGKQYSLTLQTSNQPEEIKIAELLKIDLAKIGINVTIKSVEANTRDSNVQTGDYELLLIYYGNMGGDPNYLNSFYGKNATILKGWNNQEVFDLLEAQSIEPNIQTRHKMVNKIQELLYENVPMIMLVGAIDNFVYHPDHYDGWSTRYDHNKVDHVKLSYLEQP